MPIKDRQEEKRICEDIIRALDKPRRLIDADKLKADFIGKRYGTQAIEYVIDQQPTVDAEPVVRCKDCKQFVQTNAIHDGECPKLQLFVNKDYYCWWGERREDAEIH